MSESKPVPAVPDDVRASDPVERLLEESWDGRSRHMSRRELVSESVAAVAFLACAIPLAVSSAPADPVTAAVLGLLYAVVSRMTKFPIGAGYVVPSWIVLVPM